MTDESGGFATFEESISSRVGSLEDRLDEIANKKEKTKAQTEEIHFLNGNRNSPVIFLGDDPSNDAEDVDGKKVNPGQDNVLVVPLGVAQSVPRVSVSKTEGTPEA